MAFEETMDEKLERMKREVRTQAKSETMLDKKARFFKSRYNPADFRNLDSRHRRLTEADALIDGIVAVAQDFAQAQDQSVALKKSFADRSRPLHSTLSELRAAKKELDGIVDGYICCSTFSKAQTLVVSYELADRSLEIETVREELRLIQAQKRADMDRAFDSFLKIIGVALGIWGMIVFGPAIIRFIIDFIVGLLKVIGLLIGIGIVLGGS
jgi:hypothetical protein